MKKVVNKTDKMFLSWAGLVDLGFQMALGNVKETMNDKSALKELKAALLRKGEEGLRAICRMARKLR